MAEGNFLGEREREREKKKKIHTTGAAFSPVVSFSL